MRDDQQATATQSDPLTQADRSARQSELANQPTSTNRATNGQAPTLASAPVSGEADATATGNNTEGGDGSAESDGQENLLAKPDNANKANVEAKQSAIHAPKGEAFSKMMAAQNGPGASGGQAGLQDLAMQSDPTLKLDSAAPLPGSGATVRLTGMEAFTRTGQVPPQAASSNAQALAAQISKFAGKGETRFEIRLDPANLGKVDVRLTIGSDGQTRAHLFVEKSETLDFLMRDQRMLERSLQQSGLTLDKDGMNFSLMDQQGRGQQMYQEQQSDLFGDDRGGSETEAQDETIETASVLEPAYSRNYVASDGVNLVI